MAEKKLLYLLLADFANPYKDLVAATLGWMCQEKDVLFDVYYASGRSDGGIFSPHGTLVLGGRHHSTVARAMALHATTLIRMDRVEVLASLVERGADEIIEFNGSLVDLYEAAAAALGLDPLSAAVLIQQEGLPRGITQGISHLVPTQEGHRLLEDETYPRRPAVARYAYPEVTHRRALALPLELPTEEIAKLAPLGIRQVWTVALPGADLAAWQAAGLSPAEAVRLEPADTWQSLTFRLANKWLDSYQAVDLCEPILASTWLPYVIRENRLMVHGDVMVDAAQALVPLLKAKEQTYFFGRYGGGSSRGAISDEALFPIFENNTSFEVIEPGRPLLSIFASDPQPLPQPALSPYDLEPSDDELREWLAQGKIPVAMVFHSGEMSHDDGMLNIMDLSAATGVKVGLGVHFQRYLFNPECVEPTHTPIEQGGVLGLVEPVLHSSGLGIVAEALADPQIVACQMADARARIAAVAGERFVPRGVYCYLDTPPTQWQAHNPGLWQAVAAQGFEYLISSSTQSNDPQILYKQGNFAVLNQNGKNRYPFSPFMRIDTAADLAEHERFLIGREGPGWMMSVLDCPIYAYSTYLSIGDPWKHRGGLGQFYSYILEGGESGRVVSATPHTIYRFARLAADLHK